jgi:hypothetical protein
MIEDKYQVGYEKYKEVEKERSSGRWVHPISAMGDLSARNLKDTIEDPI